jgi:hypothetical protein
LKDPVSTPSTYVVPGFNHFPVCEIREAPDVIGQRETDTRSTAAAVVVIDLVFGEVP